MLKLLRIGQAILLCGAQSFIGLAVNLVHCGLPFGKHFAHGLVKKFFDNEKQYQKVAERNQNRPDVNGNNIQSWHFCSLRKLY